MRRFNPTIQAQYPNNRFPKPNQEYSSPTPILYSTPPPFNPLSISLLRKYPTNPNRPIYAALITWSSVEIIWCLYSIVLISVQYIKLLDTFSDLNDGLLLSGSVGFTQGLGSRISRKANRPRTALSPL